MAVAKKTTTACRSVRLFCFSPQKPTAFLQNQSYYGEHPPILFALFPLPFPSAYMLFLSSKPSISIMRSKLSTAVVVVFTGLLGSFVDASLFPRTSFDRRAGQTILRGSNHPKDATSIKEEDFHNLMQRKMMVSCGEAFFWQTCNVFTDNLTKQNAVVSWSGRMKCGVIWQSVVLGQSVVEKVPAIAVKSAEVGSRSWWCLSWSAWRSSHGRLAPVALAAPGTPSCAAHLRWRMLLQRQLLRRLRMVLLL